MLLLLLLLFPLLFVSCGDNEINPKNEKGKLSIHFQHFYHDQILEFDSITYINEAGNHLIFNEIQYFISDVTLHYSDGRTYPINQWKEIHYVDSDIPSSLKWDVYDSIPVGIIDSISFTFGISEEDNTSYMYVNPPESLMFWPDILGGGYHYLKLNGKWVNEEQQLSPFNFHLGIGQIYDSTGQITGFVQNYFKTGAVLPVYSSYLLNVIPGQTAEIAVAMDVDSWFSTPQIWDFDIWGGDIMQNQDAMHAACENGKDAFRLNTPFWF
jgi:hypothetical protein